MIEASSTPTAPAHWIDLSQCDDPRDAVHQAVACLAQGGVLGVATEAACTLVASTLNPAGLGRLRALGRLADSDPLLILVRGVEESRDWAPAMPAVGRRLTERLWPGPLVLQLPQAADAGLSGRLPREGRELLAPSGDLALACTAEPFLRGVAELISGHLAMGKVSEDQAAAGSSQVLRGIRGLDLVVDCGSNRTGRESTVIRVDDQGWSVLRQGAIDERTLVRMSSRIILFVCTGNTCRSPMAEAICKSLLARKYDCDANQLEAKGMVVLSAGVATAGGSPAASQAVEVLRSLGGSLESHRSRRVTADLVRQADYLFAMTVDHLDALLDVVPEAGPHAMLLDPAGRDVPDPFGADQEVYRQTARALEAMIRERLREIGI